MRKSTVPPLGLLKLLLIVHCRYDMYKDIEEKLASRRKAAFADMDKWIRGLPVGLKLSNGVMIKA